MKDDIGGIVLVIGLIAFCFFCAAIGYKAGKDEARVDMCRERGGLKVVPETGNWYCLEPKAEK
jgi:hypothetical protein